MSGKIEDTCCSKTNLDFLDFWMSSVSSSPVSNTNHRETLLPEMLPPVFLVCTHADKPYRTDVDPGGLDSEIYSFLKDEAYGKLLKGLFVVDNSKSGSGDECRGVIKLRGKVLSFAKKLPQLNEAILLKWLKYENVLHLLSKEGYNWVLVEKARQIGTEECGICDDKQFRTLLNSLHDQRVLIHFTESPELENVVILTPQWLIDVFKKVITFKGWEDVEDDFKELWRNLEDHGILAEKLLDHAWKHLFVNQENCKSLIAIMKKFSLLCEWPSEVSTKQYLVPSMLRSPPTSDVLELLASAPIPSLFVRFESRRVPPGLFSRLIVLFHVWAQKRWKSPIKPLLFNNLALFHIRPHNSTSLVLLCHFSSIEIVLCVGDGEALADQAGFSCEVDLNVSRDIRRQMRLFLECMRKECSWLEHMRYEMCVSCPVCSLQKLSSKCRDHCLRGCECLHLLSELEMQNLPFCKRPVGCGVRRICKEMFVPWFSFSDGQEGRISLTKQQDANGRNQGEHHAVSRREQSLALPNSVLKAIRSQSCDAADVVAQMEESVENLQLRPAALVDPTPETKEWIRCLAITAKNENRMDIVTHLRSITPAGTTGPLLAEHLDVRCIPFKLRKALTFNLCGGDEWKQLAEKLGISYDEIRFLDERTLNPCNVVLDLVANSRHLNVGEVYYILVECDLAGSADLL
ncbi:unnamed protein product [Porites lobata]|uniref:Death domain-containing protein n=1 Tax=Porites lobata TaxID=104759 RepID=A0ABN8RPV0_9CNID|nr:unnamed protein product [Porites lobata]